MKDPVNLGEVGGEPHPSGSLPSPQKPTPDPREEERNTRPKISAGEIEEWVRVRDVRVGDNSHSGTPEGDL